MPSLRFAGIPAAVALFLSPIAAHAQSCTLLRLQRDRVVRDFLGIAADYPRTHALLAVCFLDSRQTQRQVNACAEDALRTACNFFDCDDLVARWRDAAWEMNRIEQAMRRAGPC